MTLHVDSEVGRLRQAILHRPDLELKRLTPTNKDAYLFDDVLWVKHAKQEHGDTCGNHQQPVAAPCPVGPECIETQRMAHGMYHDGSEHGLGRACKLRQQRGNNQRDDCCGAPTRQARLCSGCFICRRGGIACPDCHAM